MELNMQTIQTILVAVIVLAAAGWLLWKMTRKKDNLCDSCEGCNLPSLDEFKRERERDRGGKGNPSRTPDKPS
jgi:hypothetical protein